MIRIVDDLSPEVTAMLQALYSRSPASVVDHLAKVKTQGAEKFMASYYVGYGHKSIGDCGTTTLFVEGVSMLAAKAVQDNPLYNGQEASTRYMDFSGRAMICPIKEGEASQQEWMSLYKEALDATLKGLEEQYPFSGAETGQSVDSCVKAVEPGAEAVEQNVKKLRVAHNKALQARAFDICRSLIPAGMTTNLSWHTTLSLANEHLKMLRHHPLMEVRGLSEQVHDALKEKYPSSFGHKRYVEQEAYVADSMAEYGYYFEETYDKSYSSHLEVDVVLDRRPIKTELHHRARRHGTLTFKFPLDYGSFRDLQRHRSCIQEMPLLTTKLGFHEWYLAQFSSGVKARIVELTAKIDALVCTDEERQYYIPMGFKVPCRVIATLPSAVYIAELRSGATVHPTLREIAKWMGCVVAGFVKELHIDTSDDALCLRRGQQDIVLK